VALQKYQKDIGPVLRRAVEKIKGDHRSGATTIALNVLGLAVRIAGKGKALSDERARKVIAVLFDEVIRAHPQMGILYYLCRECKKKRLRSRQDFREFAAQFKSTLEAQQAGNARGFARQLKLHSKVITTSYSSSVARALVEAGPRKIRVVVSESRPMLEGRELASLLSENKIPVTLVVDAALGLHVPGAGAVVLGVDAVTPDYFVNKIGSLALCLLAREFGVPVILLTDTFRLLGKGIIRRRQVEHPVSEVIRRPQPYTIDNRYFDFVPLRLVNKIICNGGTLTPRQLFKERSLREIP